jgi:aryl-alcohol dehydrogenase-like predicted oxidoreductase
MKYIRLKDLKLSVIGLGTDVYGTSIPREKCFGLMDTFLEMGGNLLDTANIYADWLPGEKGASERTIGDWMKERGNRDKVLVGTKGAHPPLSDMSVSRVTARDIRDDIEESLRRLRTDYIDIYYLHRDDIRVPVEEILDILNGFVAAGSIRYFACSNWITARLEAARKHAESSGKDGFLLSQIGWSLATPNPGSFESTLVYMDDAQLEYYRKKNFPVAAFSPQANGFFSDKYGRGIMPADGAANSVVKHYYNEKNFSRQEKAELLAQKKGVTVNQIALAYLLNQGFPVAAVIGTGRLEHMREACVSSEIMLSKEELRLCD